MQHPPVHEIEKLGGDWRWRATGLQTSRILRAEQKGNGFAAGSSIIEPTVMLLRVSA